jgi:aldehyde dehydrogenase (NAD+)
MEGTTKLSYDKIYINGRWVTPVNPGMTDLNNPASGEVSGQAIRGNAEDVDLAVKAAKEAFTTFSKTTKKERIAYLQAFAIEYQKRMEDIMRAVTLDIGSPVKFNNVMHGPAGLVAINNSIEALQEIELEKPQGKSLIVREPMGVAALISAWNWPSMMVTSKISTALAAGCTIVFKPAELATHTAIVIAEILDAINLPKGVFNMVLGKGSVVGDAMTSHPDVDFISFTGSEGVGAKIAKNAADTAKRVGLELGGKSAFIVLPDADITEVAPMAVMAIMPNSGQMCGAGSRTIVPANMHDAFVEVMKAVVQGLIVGDPTGDADLGPVVSDHQWENIQKYIQSGIDEGARLVIGGTGKPEGLEQGSYVKPTVFADANNDMNIAREEIFGPVATVIPYSTIEEAIEIANDSPYGLAGYVFGADHQQAVEVAKQLRTGYVSVNTIEFDLQAPWGGYKTSGVGRENGVWGIEEMLEVKAINNYLLKE